MRTEQRHIEDLQHGDLASADLCLQLWVNSDAVSFHQLPMPGVPARKIADLLPWSAEDQLVQFPDLNHFVFLSRDDENLVSAFVVPRAEMEQLRMQTMEQSAAVRCMVPDVLALPWSAGSISLARKEHRLLVRDGEYSGYSGSIDFVTAVLARQIESQPESSVAAYGLAEGELAPALDSAVTSRNDAIHWQAAIMPQSANLLVGRYRPVTRRRVPRKWFPAMALAGLLLVLASLYAWVDYQRAGTQLAELNQTLAADYQSLFFIEAPGAASIRRAAEAQLRQRQMRFLAVEDSIWPLMRDIDPVLSACRDCELAAMQLRPGSAVLVLGAQADVSNRLQSIAGISVRQNATGAEGKISLSIERSTP